MIEEKIDFLLRLTNEMLGMIQALCPHKEKVVGWDEFHLNEFWYCKLCRKKFESQLGIDNEKERVRA